MKQSQNVVPIAELTMVDEIDVPESPPTSPNGDETRIDDPEFGRQCMAEIVKSRVLKDYQMGRPRITRSEKWGLVLRMDYRVPETKAGKHRLICWRISPTEPIQQAHSWGLEVWPEDEWLPYQPT